MQEHQRLISQRLCNATTKINDNMSFDFYKFNYTDFRFILENQKPCS